MRLYKSQKISAKFQVISVTGGIASGKSYFCKKLSKMRGVRCFSSDEMVHKLYENKALQLKLVQIFGKEILSDNKINRKILGEIVFRDKNQKKKLEEIIYPELAKQRKNIIKQLNRQNFNGVLVFEIPLLFENNLQNEFDATITIYCNKIIQKQRVLRRINMTEEKLNNILKSQMKLSEKLKRTDVKYNSGSQQFLIPSFAELLKIITSVV